MGWAMEKKLKIVFVIVSWAALLILLAVFGQSPQNNITCKKQDHGKSELCVQGEAKPVIVPYDTWRNARVGGYYDTSTEKVYSDVNDDPDVNSPSDDYIVPDDDDG
jgi:hypothetical protein